MLSRTPLHLFESDAEVRRSERALTHNPTDAAARRAHSRLLRRHGRDEEADDHDFHALGLERAKAHDDETRAMERRNKVHKAANAAYASGAKNAKQLRDKRREAFDAYQAANQHHTRLSNAWHEQAGRVHAAGGNAALAYHKPALQSDEDHQKQLAQHIANRNGVHSDHSAKEIRFLSYSGPPGERQERVGRAAREGHEAMRAHHSGASPSLQPLRHDIGETHQSVVSSKS